MSMNLLELRKQPTAELIELADKTGVENANNMRKQDIIFALLKTHATNSEDIYRGRLF